MCGYLIPRNFSTSSSSPLIRSDIMGCCCPRDAGPLSVELEQLDGHGGAHAPAPAPAPAQAPAPALPAPSPTMRPYQLIPRRVTFRNYRWQTNTWDCPCSAAWEEVEVSQREFRDGILQAFQVSNGGTVVECKSFWGDHYDCPKCTAEWDAV